ncbi:MAG: DUF3365 domain-containing protein [Alcanivoracaceae bacterium]
MNRYMTGLLVSLLVAACSESPAPLLPTPAVEPPVVLDAEVVRARGAEVLMPFKQQLMQALQQGMADGVVPAIDICRVQAPAIAEGLAGEGVAMGRSSHRLRNPANAPEPWQQQWLDYYLGSEDRIAGITDLGDGRAGYVEPIVTAPLCLACHGLDLSADVTAALQLHYPDDQATGFQGGDLRGIFWVTMPVGL